jgi:hypothetical protein
MARVRRIKHTFLATICDLAITLNSLIAHRGSWKGSASRPYLRADAGFANPWSSLSLTVDRFGTHIRFAYGRTT